MHRTSFGNLLLSIAQHFHGEGRSGSTNESPEMAVDKSMNVLVVDDYKTMVRIVRGLLEQLGFKNIDDAIDGTTALQKIQQNDYGLILSDWNMTPMTGYDLLKAVRADPRTRTTPFVMITAEAKTENVVAARQAGVNNYIIKPFTLAVLKQKLSSVLGEL
ncbi:MAG: response regulator [Brevundimonas sp.]|nr:response regulator [Brevundimonas sp.]MDZ4112274.1 response regulator [Brevundimonas sp.]